MKSYEEKKHDLAENIMKYSEEDVCVAFSGGVDSSLLLCIIKKCIEEKKTNKKVYAVTFDTMLHPACDLTIAKKVAKEAGAIHSVIHVNELEQEEIKYNPQNRCYLCKKRLFSKFIDFGREKGVKYFLDGTNEDDYHAYRPGIMAIRELGIKSPLAESGLTKADVRTYARELGLSVAKRPSTPCLATRLPYGAKIELEMLKKIALGEEYLRQLGFTVVRLRVHKEIARIEILTQDFMIFIEHREAIIRKLKELGFLYITLDIEGFRSGSMDEVL